jgi:hypothetical protein
MCFGVPSEIVENGEKGGPHLAKVDFGRIALEVSLNNMGPFETDRGIDWRFQRNLVDSPSIFLLYSYEHARLEGRNTTLRVSKEVQQHGYGK